MSSATGNSPQGKAGQRKRLGDRKPIPLVIVEGFLGGAGPLLWGNIEKYSNCNATVEQENPYRKIIFASVGPVSSLHDRACELYYALLGGTVDYGEVHARENNHARYGRAHTTGLYPQWCRENPLHFLGHSLGGPTIVKLQWLIYTGFFGDSSHPDMLLSVTTVSAPFRGSQVVYTLGEKVDAAPAVHSFSVGAFLSRGVHLASYLSPFIPFLDLHAEARSLTCHTASFRSFVKQIWRSDWAEGRDATPFDVTFQASDEREAHAEGVPHKSTFYRSYVACMTVQASGGKYARPTFRHALRAPILYLFSRVMGSFDFAVVQPTPTAVKLLHTCPEYDTQRNPPTHVDRLDSALRANDGVVPLLSQWHPFDCSSIRCRHWNSLEEASTTSTAKITTEYSLLHPGCWDVYHIEDANHFSIAPFWFGTSRQRLFWRGLGQWLQAIDCQTAVEYL